MDTTTGKCEAKVYRREGKVQGFAYGRCKRNATHTFTNGAATVRVCPKHASEYLSDPRWARVS